MFYIFHTTSLNRGALYINSSNWIKNTGATINSKNNDTIATIPNETIALNHGRTGVNRERTAKIMLFIHQCNWEDINCPTRTSDWKNVRNK